MAVTIEYNNRSIFAGANRVFIRFYYEIEKMEVERIEKDDILNLNLRELITDLDRCGSGIGLDIHDYMYTKEDFRFFIGMCKKALDNLTTYEHKNMLEIFYNKLVKAYEEFEPDPVLLSSVYDFEFYIQDPELISGKFLYNRRYLLACPIRTFLCLFDEVLPEIIRDDAVMLSANIAEMINDIHTKAFKIDLSNYTNSIDDVTLLANLIRKSINTIYQKYPNDAVEHELYYEKFYKNLLETIENFPHFTSEEKRFSVSEIISSKSKKRFQEWIRNGASDHIIDEYRKLTECKN